MAKISDLLRRVKTILDDEPDNIDIIDWFNTCQNTLTDILYFPTLATITKTNDKFYLPSNYNGELSVISPSLESYHIYDNYIKFDDSDKYSTMDISYNRLPTEITNNPDTIPDIPTQFHDVYVYFAAMQAMHPEEEPERYAMYREDYNRMLLKIQKYMGKTRPKYGNWTVIR